MVRISRYIDVCLTQHRLKEVLSYDKETGVFTRLVANSPRCKVGEKVGCMDNNGYLVMRIDYQIYKAHQLAWLYIHGKVPVDKFIDHINGVKDDNRITNLRTCSNAENQKNRKLQINNTSGYKGVSWDKQSQKWRALAMVNGKNHYIGSFEVKKDAIEAHKLFCTQHHGEFYRDTTKETDE